MDLLDTNASQRTDQEGATTPVHRSVTAASGGDALHLDDLRDGTPVRGSRRANRDTFWERIQDEILSRVGILTLGLRETLLAGDVLAELSLQGRTIAPEDLLIGATALAHGYVVVTDNVRHFTRIPNLQVENWLT